MSQQPDYGFKLSSKLTIRMERFGQAREPVLVIDDVLEHPSSMVDYASDEVAFEPAWSENGGYPGLRAPAPLNYVEQIARNLAPVMVKAWSMGTAGLSRARCFLALVTLRPGQLKPLQTVPHFDTTDPRDFAMLHYLCRPDQGGTAFYRHRATGLELVDRSDDEQFTRTRDAELSSRRDPADFIRADTNEFEQIGHIEAKFNRAIVYRSQLLHSGVIPKTLDFSPDPRKGRLTANVFVSFRSKESHHS